MLRLKLYYLAKPLLSQRFRMSIRRALAKRQREHYKDIWPIPKNATAPPEGWPGWPDEKRFCFSLSHDVEGLTGLSRVKQLAELEMECGFRSSFNFIPEGEYEVPDDLIEWLKANGFEVGVHDLHHDGRLYESKKVFEKNSKRINHYLKKWGAVGFRSGFMLRNLDWIHQLDIDYDASTFDTDPFEPQPDGAHTIFPFWIPRPDNKDSQTGPKRSREIALEEPIRNQRSAISNGSSTHPESSGYIELPYTLPQDSTLFLLFQEKDNQIWKDKLDWIAENQGFAFLNLHPDYIALDKESPGPTEFDPDRYRDFLNHVKTAHSGQYWHALPKEVSEYCRSFKPSKTTRAPKNVCMLAFTDYESDGRIIRYAETLARRGDHVDVIACAQEHEALSVTESGGANLYKIYNRKENRKGGAFSYFVPLALFAIKAFFIITRNHFRRRYDLIHVHNIPEWLVFSTWIPKLSGAKIILDLHDLVPELFSAKFNKGSRSLFDSALKTLERWSCRFSDHVIISNDLWKKTVTHRSVEEQRCSVFFNNIDPELFYPREKTRQDDRKIVIFPGTLQWHQGVDIAIQAFPQVRAAVPTAEFHIYGGGGVVHELKELVSKLNLEDTVLFKGHLPITEIPQTIANADIGVVPKRADSFGNEAYSTKIMEFMSQRLPTVISRTAIDDFYFDDSQTYFCESGNVDEFARAMIATLTDVELRSKLIENASAYVAKNDWNSKKQEYLSLVDRLVGGINEPFSNDIPDAQIAKATI